MKEKTLMLWAGMCGFVLLSGCAGLPGKTADYAAYVNPFIGTAYNGHTFPGACVPFGLVQASPETGNGEWRYCSGYNNDDDSFYS